MVRTIIIGLCIATIALASPTVEEIVPETELFSGTDHPSSFEASRAMVASLLSAGKTHEQCRKLASDSSSTIKLSVKNSQKILDELPDGSACSKTHDTAVNKAQDLKTKADEAASKAATAAAKACDVEINFGNYRLSELKPGNCDIFYSASVYTNAVKACQDAKQAKEKADGAKAEAAKALENTKTTAAEARTKCFCQVQAEHKTEWEKATTSEKANEKDWTQAHHIECVLDGTPADKCQVPKCPAPTKPQMTAAAKAAICKTKGLAMTVYYNSGMYWDSELWTDDTTGQLSGGNYKDPQLWFVKIKKLRVRFTSGSNNKDLHLDIPNKSLQELFKGGMYKTNIPVSTWHGLGGTIHFGWQKYCNKQGFNVATGPMKARFGIIMNENGAGDCSTPDTEIGVGFNKNTFNQCAGGYCTCCAQGGSCQKTGSIVKFYINGA